MGPFPMSSEVQDLELPLDELIEKEKKEQRLKKKKEAQKKAKAAPQPKSPKTPKKAATKPARQAPKQSPSKQNTQAVRKEKAFVQVRDQRNKKVNQKLNAKRESPASNLVISVVNPQKPKKTPAKLVQPFDSPATKAK